MSACAEPPFFCESRPLAEGQRQACSRTVQAALKTPAPTPLQVCLSSNAKCGRTWDNGISLTQQECRESLFLLQYNNGHHGEECLELENGYWKIFDRNR